MKFVLLIAAILALVWLLRSTLRRRVRPPTAENSPPKQTQPMLACALCGVHLPRDEALPGQGGVFCSEAHRARFEQSPPGS